MDLNEELILSYYKEISTLNAAHGVYLVQHTGTGRVYVKKQLSLYDQKVYLYLKMHPIAHTPVIYEVVEDQNLLTVIEEYVNGKTLDIILKERGCLSVQEAASIARQLCDIVHNLHSAAFPIIHRDIKPSNIIISDSGMVTLLDMSAAKSLDNEKSQDTNLLGTFHYAAPEQYGFGQSVPQTDIYALGILINVMLKGVFPNESLADEPFGNIIKKCTHLDPKDRYSTASELKSALEAIPDKDTALHQGERESKAQTKVFSFLPLGFRTLKPVRMLIASLGYALLIALSVTLKVKDTSGADLWINRIFFFLLFFTVVNLATNWFNIWGRLHLKPVFRILIIILIVLGAAVVLLSLMGILLSLL